MMAPAAKTLTLQRSLLDGALWVVAAGPREDLRGGAVMPSGDEQSDTSAELALARGDRHCGRHNHRSRARSVVT